jgi:ABC-2 type transport system permease protein
MHTPIRLYWPILYQLLRADFIGSRPLIKNRIIDTCIFVAFNVIISGFLLVGVRADFGIFMVATFAGSACSSHIYSQITEIVVDLTNNKVITYELTLPLPSWLAIARIAISNAVQSLLASLVIFPFGLLFVWQQFDPTHFSTLWFSLFFITSCVFCGFFGLLAVSFIPSVQQLRIAWLRIIYPMWMMGGMQFTWATLYERSSFFGYLALANPFTYMQEGMRGAVLGQAGSIPCWICFVILIGFSAASGLIGIKRMMKRLDCV